MSATLGGGGGVSTPCRLIDEGVLLSHLVVRVNVPVQKD